MKQYQNTDVPVRNCWKEAWTSGHRIKWNCGICQACKDRELARKIREEHKYGSFCKGNRNNHCGICAEIKWRIKLLFHTAHQCMKRCPFCECKSDYLVKAYGSQIKAFYKMMLCLKNR